MTLKNPSISEQHFQPEALVATLRINSLAMALGRVHRLSSGDTLTVPSETTMSTAGLIAEGTDIAPSDPVFEPLAFDPVKAAARTMLSAEFADDAWVPAVTGSHIAAIARTIDEVAFGALAAAVPAGQTISMSGIVPSPDEVRAAMAKLPAVAWANSPSMLLSPVTAGLLSGDFQVDGEVRHLYGLPVYVTGFLGGMGCVVGDVSSALHLAVIDVPRTRSVDQSNPQDDLVEVITTLRFAAKAVGANLAAVGGMSGGG